MEVNETRGRLGRKNFRGKSVKKESPKGKRHHRKREKGKPLQRKYDCFPIRRDLSSRVATIILPGLPAVCGHLFHSWGRLTHSAFTFRFRQKGQRKKKNHLKPRKSTSWHRRKKKGALLHQSKHRLGVRQCPFLRLCDSRHTFVQNSFWAMVFRRTKPLLRKNLMNEGIKKREFISKSRIK